MSNSEELHRLEEALETADREWRATFDSMSDAIWVLDTDNRIVRCNKSTAELFGMEPGELVGRHCWEVVHQGDHPVDSCPAIRMRQTLRRESMELQLGDSWFHITVDPILDETGEITGIVHITRDITERKRSEEALRENEERYRRLVELLPDAIIVTVRGKFAFLNAAALAMHGATKPEDMLGRQVAEFIVAEYRELARTRMASLIDGTAQSVPAMEERFVRLDGSQFDVEVAAARVIYQGEPAVLAVIRDISERERVQKRAADLSRMNERLVATGTLGEKLKLITDALVETLDADFARVWVLQDADLCANGCIHATTQVPYACRDRSRCLHLVASSGRYTHLDGGHSRVPMGAYKIGRVASGEDPKFITNDVIHDPHVHNHQWARDLGLVSFAGFRLLSPEGKPIGVMALFSKRAISRDEEALLEDLANTASQVVVTCMATDALRESEEKYRDLVETTETGYLIVDSRGLVVDANAEYLRLTGRQTLEEILGHSVLEWTADYDLERNAAEVKKCAETGIVRNLEIDYVSPDGRKITPIEVNGTVIETRQGPKILTLCRDISERRRAKAALWESEEKFRTLFESGNDAIFIVDQDCFVDCNEQAVRIFGCTTKDEIIGQPPSFFSPPQQPDGRDSNEKAIETNVAALSGVPQSFEWQNTRLDGTPFEAEVTLHAIELHGKTVLQAIARDITDRRRAEAEKRAFYRQTIMSVTNGKLLICDADDVEPYLREAKVTIDVAQADDMVKARRAAETVCRNAGLTGGRLDDFMIAAGEAITNAVKHGTSARTYAGAGDGTVWIGTMDNGHGIDSLILPKAVLRRGFSTKPSLGLGYTIMLEVADRVLLCTGPTGTTVVLIKNPQDQPAPSLGDVVDTWEGIKAPS